MNIGKLLGAIVKVATANPALVVGAYTVGKQIVKAVKDEAKAKPGTPQA